MDAVERDTGNEVLLDLTQPRSQALSSLPPFVVEELVIEKQSREPE